MVDVRPPAGSHVAPTAPGTAEGSDPTPVPSMVRSSAIVGIATAGARLTGFVRLFATAYAIDFSRLTDTYTIANTPPNIVYELLLGGVLSATLVPVFIQHRHDGDERGVSAVVTVATAALAVASVIGFFLAPVIVAVFTVGVSGTTADDQQQVATALLRTFMPQLVFYGLTAMAMALLNARRRFVAAAVAPAVNNLVVAAVLMALPTLAGGHPTLRQLSEEPALLLTLGLGTTAGIVAMTLVLWPPLLRAGVRIRFVLDWRHPSVRQVGRMSTWTAAYVLCNSAALLVFLILANRVEGGISAYTAAFIFFLLPHALFAVSIMTTLVPELSAAVSRHDFNTFRHRFSTGISLMALVVLPAATGYVVLAHPIVSALLEHGLMRGSSADLTGDTLSAFGAGLFGFSVFLYVLRGFYSLRDTRTPFYLNMGQNLLQIALAFPLKYFLGIPGLALAYGGGHTIAAVVALVALRRRTGSLDGRRVAGSITRISIACAVMAGAVLLTTRMVGGPEGVGALVRMAAGIGVGTTVYFLAILVLRVDEIATLRERLMRRS